MTITEINRSILVVEKERSSLVAEMRRVESDMAKIPKTSGEWKNLKSERGEIEGRLSDTKVRLRALNMQRDEARSEVSEDELIRRAYKLIVRKFLNSGVQFTESEKNLLERLRAVSDRQDELAHQQARGQARARSRG